MSGTKRNNLIEVQPFWAKSRPYADASNMVRIVTRTSQAMCGGLWCTGFQIRCISGLMAIRFA
jgi:hypothetical protein